MDSKLVDAAERYLRQQLESDVERPDHVHCLSFEVLFSFWSANCTRLVERCAGGKLRPWSRMLQGMRALV